LTVFEILENKVVFIDFLGFSSAEAQIRKVAQRNGVLVRTLSGCYPEPKSKKNIFNILSLIKNPIISLEKLFFFIKKKFEQIRIERTIPDYLVIGGTRSMLSVNNKKTSVIKAHNFDYDFFIREKYTQLNKKEKFLVFLDEYIPYHPDYVRFGIRPYAIANKYYPVIDLGLSEIAKSFNLKIKIAAHPRSNYGLKKKKYKHTILENKTFELIRDADVVVSHMSTALQWAVFMKKPIIFVTTDEIQNEFYAKSFAKGIDYFAETLGKNVVNLSNLSSINYWGDYLNVDEKKYDKYIETYIKTKESQQKLFWDIVIERIQKDLTL
jgi:hypothetical protein